MTFSLAGVDAGGVLRIAGIVLGPLASDGIGRLSLSRNLNVCNGLQIATFVPSRPEGGAAKAPVLVPSGQEECGRLGQRT